MWQRVALLERVAGGDHVEEGDDDVDGDGDHVHRDDAEDDGDGGKLRKSGCSTLAPKYDSSIASW